MHLKTSSLPNYKHTAYFLNHHQIPKATMYLLNPGTSKHEDHHANFLFEQNHIAPFFRPPSIRIQKPMAQKYRFVKRGKASRQAEAKPIKEAIQSLLKSYQIDRKFNYATIINSWPNLMGKTIASRTGKIFIKEQKLYVEIQSAPLRSDMRFSKQKIMNILNEHIGKEVIKDVIFL